MQIRSNPDQENEKARIFTHTIKCIIQKINHTLVWLREIETEVNETEEAVKVAI